MKLILIVISIIIAGINHDDIDLQISNISEKIITDPLNHNLYLNRGKLFYKKQRYLSAIRDFEQCLKLDPSQTETYLDLAICWSNLQQFDYSIDLVDRLLSESENNENALRLKGKILISDNKYIDGVAKLEKALTICQRKLPEHYLKIVTACLESNNEILLTKAKDILIDGVRVLGPLAVLQRRRVSVHLALKQYAQAIRVQTEIINLFARKEFALYDRALLYNSTEEFDKTLKDIDSAYGLIEALPNKFRKSPAINSLLGNLDELTIKILEVE